MVEGAAVPQADGLLLTAAIHLLLTEKHQDLFGLAWSMDDIVVSGCLEMSNKFPPLTCCVPFSTPHQQD